MNYYNDNDPKSAAWMRELIKEGLIPNGHVDERSITDVSPADLDGFTQCHFFAGIGWWSLALKLAGWPEDMPVWTGSCPCQPFSSAGRQRGTSDERHLWPALFDLIRQRKPECVFGEQVASAIGHGWLDGISSDLESEGYSCGAVVLGAHSVGAPHIRQRLYWVADADLSKRDEWTRSGEQPLCVENENAGRLVLPNGSGRHTRKQTAAPVGHGNPTIAASGTDGMADAERSQGRCEHRDSPDQLSAWSSSVAIACTDGKARRIESGSFPLAHGIPGRVGLLRGYGNAIVPQVAAEFIKAFIECRQDGAMNSV